MKSLIFSTAYFPFIGGAEIALKELADRIDGLEFDMVTAKLDRKLPDIEKIGSINVYRVGFGLRTLDKFLLPIFGYFKACELHKKNNYDITWAMMASQASVAAGFFKKKFSKVPLLLTLQEGDDESHLKRYVLGSDWLYKLLIRPWHTFAVKKADYIQVISKYLKRRAILTGAQAEIEVVPNAVDLRRFTREFSLEEIDELRDKLKLKKEDKYLITTSRLVRKNAIGDVIRALPKLPANVKFLILGNGPRKKKLKDLAQSLGVSDRVIFFDWIDHKELPKYLKLADIFIRPSISEGLGNSFLEAMASRIPVIATPVGGIPDFLFDRKTGLFTEVKNPNDIAKKVKLYLRDVKLREEIIENAYQLVVKNYDWDVIAKKIDNIFNKMEKNRGQKRILITTETYPPDIGGPAYYVKNIRDRLLGEGCKVVVITYSNNPKKIEQGIIKIKRSHFLLFRYLKFFLAVYKYSKSADVIFSQGPMSEGLPTYVACYFRKKDYVLKITGDHAWEQGRQRFEVKEQLDDFYDHLSEYSWPVRLIQTLESRVAKRAKLIITPSNYLKRIVQKWGVREEKIKVIYNSVKDISVSKEKKDLKEELELNGKIILSVGCLVKWKGFKGLIKLISELREIDSSIRLVIIGEGPERGNLEFDIKQFNIEDNVKLVGHIEQERLFKYFKASDVFILNSAHENLSQVIIEAMQIGTPVIATRLGGNPELIRAGENGLFVKYDDILAIKEAVLSLFNDNFLKEKIIANARLDIKQKFNQDKMFSELIEAIGGKRVGF